MAKILPVLRAVKKANPRLPDGDYRILEPVIIGEIIFALQANEFTKCSPRGVFPLEYYDEFEIHLTKIDGGSFNIKRQKVLRDYKRRKELEECFEGNRSPYGSYVPVELCNDFYLFLKRVFDSSNSLN